MEIKRKRILSVSLAVLLTLTGMIAIAPTSTAKPEGNDSKEKLQIESVTWDTTNQGFVVALSLNFGLATAGEHADFLVATTLNFDAGGNSVTLNGENAIVKAEDATKDSDNMITIDPAFIPWDRNGGQFEGPVEVTAEARVELSPDVQSGKIVAILAIIIEIILVTVNMQRKGGTLQGTVTNSETGDPLDLVDISVSSIEFVTSGQTNLAGEYLFHVRVGVYSVTFEKVGFSTENVAGVVVNQSDVITVDADLDPIDEPIPPPTPTD